MGKDIDASVVSYYTEIHREFTEIHRDSQRNIFLRPQFDLRFKK